MRRGLSPEKKPMFRLEKRGEHWCVVARISGLLYSSPSYPKAVGVLEYLEQRALDRK